MPTAANVEQPLRIGDLSALVGTTPRTIRYYEEIGLLPAPPGHEKGRQRLYGEADVARLRDLIRLRDLLGVPLDELRGILEAEEARAALRERFHRTDDCAVRRAILSEGLEHVEAQLALVRRRREALGQLERELSEKQRSLRTRLRRLARPVEG